MVRKSQAKRNLAENLKKANQSKKIKLEFEEKDQALERMEQELNLMRTEIESWKSKFERQKITVSSHF